MTTTYDVRRLDLRQKLQTCTHVVTGVIDGIESVEIEELEKGKRVITVFGINVSKVEFGIALPSRVLVRVVGGSSAGVSTRWTASMEPNQKCVLVLAPDFGNRPDQFVPCFGSIFAINAKGSLDVGSDVAAELRSLARSRIDARITPAIVGAAAKAVRSSKSVIDRRSDVHEVALDRVVSMPSDSLVREIRRASDSPKPPRRGKKGRGR
jgi:hypothetical protein